jgi:hypothetical protein
MTEKAPKKKKSLFRRILKWTGITFLVLILFLIAAPFIFKDKIVQFIKDEANANLNAKVDFGDFDLTLFSSFPDFTLSVNNVTVANVEPFKGDTLFSTKNLTATINLMSVISGDQYKIRTIVLDHPRIFAKVKPDGKASYDITKPSTDTTKTTTTAAPSKFKMSLKKLEIKDGYIVYDDAAMGFYTSLAGFDHTLSGDFTQDNFVLETLTGIKEFTLAYGGVKYLNKVKTEIKANLDADMPNFKFTFKDNSISLNELTLGIDGSFAMPGKDMVMDMKFKADKTEFKNFLSLIPGCYSKEFASVKTAGKLSLDGFVKGTYNDKVMPGFGAHIKIDDAMFQYPSLPAAAKDIAVDVKIDNPTGDPDKTVIDVKKFHIELAGNPVDMNMHVETPVSDPFINGAIMGRINLASLKTVVPLGDDQTLNGNITMDVKLNGHTSSLEKGQYDKFNAEGKVILIDMDYKSKDVPYGVMIKSMTLNFSPQFVELAGFDSKIGRSDIQADGKISNFMQYLFSKDEKNKLLKGKFNMRSTIMDLNEFMTSSEPTADPNAKAPAPADTSAMAVIDVPGNIDFELNSSITKLVYDKLDITNVGGTISIRDKKIDLTNLKMNLLGGTMTMSGNYMTRDITHPTVDLDLNISNFDIQQTYKYLEVVQKLAPVAQYAAGRFSTTLKFTSALDKKMSPLMNSLTGEGTLQTTKVMVSGFEPLNKLADALKMDKFRKAEFSDLKIKYSVKDGKVTTDEFPFKSGSVLGSMLGSTALDQTIDYKMKMEVPTKDMPDGAKQYVNGLLQKANMLGVNAQLPEKVKLNALFGGTVLKPTVQTDVKEIARNLKDNIVDKTKEIIKEKKDSIVKDVKKDVSKEVEKILKDAEAEAQKVKDAAKTLSDQTKKEGYANAQKLEDEAKNPVAKIAAKKAAEKVRKETDEKCNKIIAEGNKRSDDIMKAAHEKADKLKQ